MRKIFLLVVFLSVGLMNHLYAQANDYRIHAVFLYNFTKYVQWPTANQAGDFVIGVVGNSPIYDELTKIMTGKTAGSQKIVIKKFKNADDVGSCHMLFVPSNISFESVQAKLSGKPTLLITEKPGLAQKGSNINFVIKDNKWRFELNENSTRSSGLKVASELAKLAITV